MNDKIDRIVDDIYSEGFSVCENFISHDEVNLLLEAFRKTEPDMKIAGIGKQEKYIHENKIRNDKIHWINKNENEITDSIFLDRIDLLTQALNQRCYLGLNNNEFHFAKYEPGAFYKRHKDSFSNDDSRKISAILYLNVNWQEGDGGELKIYLDKELSVKPKAGTFVVFESHIEHEVLISNKDRISITGWIKKVRNTI